MMKRSKQLLSILLTLVLLFGMLPAPASAAELIGRDTIPSVAITVDRPVAGEPLSTCVPKTTLCDITCTWSVRGPKGITEIPASTIAEAGTTYYLAMVLTPTLPLYTFADSVTGTVNGNTVTITRANNKTIGCMVPITPKTTAGTVDVSVPQPAYGAAPGTPAAAGGRTVTDYTWYRNHPTGLYDRIQLGEGDVFTGSYTYWMEATVKASSDEVFDENTTVTVNGQATTILTRDLEANTITFRYDVAEIIHVAGNIYVASGSGESWYLTHGDTKTNAAGTYTASYESGVLTLTNTGGSTIGGTCKVPNQSRYAGIYADGDLTVHLNGDFHFDLSGTPTDAAFVYGIYTVGDLTLVNKSAADCTVSFTPADGVLATHGSSGICCDAGSLTVENKGDGDFTLNADAVGVQLVGGAVIDNFTNNGIYAAGSITIGDNCTVNATAADVELSSWGTTTSRGIDAYRGLTIGKNAVVTATGGDINPSQSATNLNLGNYQYCYGVEVRGGDITVNGGTLTATGGNIDYGTITGAGNMGLGQECYGIYSNGSNGITLNGGTITATAGYSRANAFVESSLSRGIFCNLLTVSRGTLTAAADDAWLESTGLWVQGVLKQTGGTITGTGGVAVCLQGNGRGSKGIYVINTLIASGGSLTATGGTMGIQQSSVGLQAGKIELSGTAQVTGYGGLATTDPIETPVTGESSFASYPGDSIGVWTFDDLTVDGNAVLTATGGTVRGNRYSYAEAMSIGLNIITADDCTISGSGTIVATGGETHYGGKGNNYYDSSCGIYGETLSLTIDGTTVIAAGGDVSTETDGGNGVSKGGVSYGLYLPGSSLALEEGAELTATGGENPTYSDNYTQKSQVNNSYGAYVGGDITVTDSVLTATGGLSIRTVGLYNGGTVTLNGLNSRLTATADEYYEDAPGVSSEVYCYGAMNGDGYNPGGAYTVNGGILLLQGQTSAINDTTKTLTAPTIQCSTNWDGSNAVNVSSPATLSMFYNNTRRYVKADGSSVSVTIRDWTYGDPGWDPSYTAYEGGDPTIRWTGTTRAGASYSANTAPTEAGSYTVTVTYPGGQTGSADFTVKPRPITTCSWNFKGEQLTYNGTEQTKSVTIRYAGTELMEGTDYTLSDNKQTNAGNYTLTITGIGNFEGTRTESFTVYQKTPTAEDFNIPAIGEYAYTGEAVELPLPTLKAPYTGCGQIAVYYEGSPTPPAYPGEYTVTFDVTAGTNFSGMSNLAYGTLVIEKADNPMEILADRVTIPVDGLVFLREYAVNEEGVVTVSIYDDGSGLNDCAKACSLGGGILRAGNVPGTFQVRVSDSGTNTHKSAEAFITVEVTADDIPAAEIYGTVTVSGTSASYDVFVLRYNNPKAYLTVVQYSGDGQQLAVQMQSCPSVGLFVPSVPFTHEEGCTYKAFLVDAEGYMPLCAAADLLVD